MGTLGNNLPLNETFADLCRIPSPFGHEQACADYVRGFLSDLNISVVEDDAAQHTTGECGNLLARIPGPSDARSILLCAHLDTVAVTGRIEPEIVDRFWVNKYDAILGADNKAAVAVFLELARFAVEAGAPVGLELLFTVSEENALEGAKHFDINQLVSDFGYVFDHATPIGEIIIAAPSYYRVSAAFRGIASHAGLRAEEGRSAIIAAARAIAGMELGRIDAETTANVGWIAGGNYKERATNIVPEACRLAAEVRSLEDSKAEAHVQELVQQLQIGANAAECDVDVTVERQFTACKSGRSEPMVVAADQALRNCGYKPVYRASGGGSDANALIEQGFPCLNLANGTERNHQPDERVGVKELAAMLDVGLELLNTASAV